MNEGITLSQSPSVGHPSKVQRTALHSHSTSPASRRMLDMSGLVLKGLGKERTVRKIIKEDWFPKPIQLGPRVFRWFEDEVDEALAIRAPRREFVGSEPVQLLRARIERMKEAGGAV